MIMGCCSAEVFGHHHAAAALVELHGEGNFRESPPSIAERAARVL
jgi:hypothetical protein